MKSGNLNFLEPSGPLQACNGTDLPFTVIVASSWLRVLFVSIMHVQTNIKVKDVRVHAMKAYRYIRGSAPLILSLGATWM